MKQTTYLCLLTGPSVSMRHAISQASAQGRRTAARSRWWGWWVPQRMCLPAQQATGQRRLTFAPSVFAFFLLLLCCSRSLPRQALPTVAAVVLLYSRQCPNALSGSIERRIPAGSLYAGGGGRGGGGGGGGDVVLGDTFGCSRRCVLQQADARSAEEWSGGLVVW